MPDTYFDNITAELTSETFRIEMISSLVNHAIIQPSSRFKIKKVAKYLTSTLMPTIISLLEISPLQH